METLQWIGVWAFGAAAASCLVAGTRPWPLLGLVNACFALEAALGWRRSLPDTIRSGLSDTMGSLGILPLATLLSVLAAGLFILAKLRRPSAEPTGSGAATTTLLTALLFLIDTASLGGIDALLNREVHGFALIGWLWTLLGAATVIAALSAARHSGANLR